VATKNTVTHEISVYSKIKKTFTQINKALLSGRPVIGGSGGAQRCDAVNVVKSGERGEEHLCAEARR